MTDLACSTSCTKPGPILAGQFLGIPLLAVKLVLHWEDSAWTWLRVRRNEIFATTKMQTPVDA